jgi:hypothetical protein
MDLSMALFPQIASWTLLIKPDASATSGWADFRPPPSVLCLSGVA